MKDHKGNEIDENWFNNIVEEYKRMQIEKFKPIRLKTRGCRLVNGRWVAQISYWGAKKTIGHYDTEEEARAAYLEAIQDWEDNWLEYWSKHNDK